MYRNPDFFKDMYAILRKSHEDRVKNGLDPTIWYGPRYCFIEMQAFLYIHNNRRMDFMRAHGLNASTMTLDEWSGLVLCEGMTVDSEGNLSLTPKDQV